jgi:hypothetical protein
MKEALITNVDGLMIDVTLVEDTVTGVLPIHEYVEDKLNPNELTDVLVGYQIAVNVPEGLYLPKWDLINGLWIEGKVFDPIVELTSAKLRKKQEISNAVGAKIVGGYQSEVVLASTGIAHFYGTSLVDQQNMTASRVDATANQTKDIKYRPQDVLERVIHTNAEFVQVSDAVLVLVNGLLDQGYLLYKQLNAATSLQEVEDIVVSIQ